VVLRRIRVRRDRQGFGVTVVSTVRTVLLRSSNACPPIFADIERNQTVLDAFDPAWRSLKTSRYPFRFQGNAREKRDGVRAYLRARGYAIAEVTVEADEWAFNCPRGPRLDVVLHPLVPHGLLATVRGQLSWAARSADGPGRPNDT
jgi:hypothetical protein